MAYQRQDASVQGGSTLRGLAGSTIRLIVLIPLLALLAQALRLLPLGSALDNLLARFGVAVAVALGGAIVYLRAPTFEARTAVLYPSLPKGSATSLAPSARGSRLGRAATTLTFLTFSIGSLLAIAALERYVVAAGGFSVTGALVIVVLFQGLLLLGAALISFVIVNVAYQILFGISQRRLRAK
jgi:hypothetical protein